VAEGDVAEEGVEDVDEEVEDSVPKSIKTIK